jgi:hypothetical protein
MKGLEVKNPKEIFERGPMQKNKEKNVQGTSLRVDKLVV